MEQINTTEAFGELKICVVINLDLPGGDLKAGFRTTDGKFLSAVTNAPLTTDNSSTGLITPGVVSPVLLLLLRLL